MEQQVTGLEKKFREALLWQKQTGQGILDEAEATQAAQEGTELDNDEDHIGAAKNETEGVSVTVCSVVVNILVPDITIL